LSSVNQSNTTTVLIFKGVQDVENVETEQQVKLASVYKQLQDKIRQLENTENEVMQLSQKVKKGQDSIWRLERVEQCLKGIKSVSTDNEDSGSIETFVDEFKFLLNDVDSSGCSKALAKRLLDLNTCVVASGIAKHNKDHYGSLLSDMKTMRTRILFQDFELMKYKCFTTEDIDSLIIASFERLLTTLSGMYKDFFLW